MDSLGLKDRDAIITEEGIIFRVYGYFHPACAYVCDVEYAPENVYTSADPRALRVKKETIYYKFYEDNGLHFVKEKYPQHTLFYEPLQERLVGVHQKHIKKSRKTEEWFQTLMNREPRDSLVSALHEVSRLILSRSGLSVNDFGVFGSLLHGFYHPSFSDIDLIVYGRKELAKLCKTLNDLYREKDSPMQNEFESDRAIKGKHWRFLNLKPKEFLWHQRRKTIYALFVWKESGRIIKTEFEPVKNWEEIYNEYNQETQIIGKGWIKAVARVTNDDDAPFIPSIYQVEIIEVLEGGKVEDIQRVLSYVEEFRMQARKDEEVYIEGNLEQVITPAKKFHQITLTRGPRYYRQVLKTLRHHSSAKIM